MPLLSVIIPVYNEEKTIEKILVDISAIEIDKEIIIVNDASSDKTLEILNKIKLNGLKIFSHPHNRGKGAGFGTGLAQASGDIVIIQDADLEYDPRDYFKLIQPILDNRADLVLGNRFAKGYKGLALNQLGNRFLTGLFNLLYSSRIKDVHTCYKAASLKTFKSFNLEANDFRLEQEIVAKAIKSKLKICEVPIEYYPRGHAEGKKIHLQDAVKVIIQMFILRFRRR